MEKELKSDHRSSGLLLRTYAFEESQARNGSLALAGEYSIGLEGEQQP